MEFASIDATAFRKPLFVSEFIQQDFLKINKIFYSVQDSPKTELRNIKCRKRALSTPNHRERQLLRCELFRTNSRLSCNLRINKT